MMDVCGIRYQNAQIIWLKITVLIILVLDGHYIDPVFKLSFCPHIIVLSSEEIQVVFELLQWAMWEG